MFFEPDHWRFGDPAGKDPAKNYPRHAQGLLLGLSQYVARYFSRNSEVLKL